MRMQAAAPAGATAFTGVNVNRVRTLAALDRRLLLAYSAHTARALRKAVPLRIAIPHIEAMLEFNVGKEIEKDARVIREAASASPDAGAEAVERLLAAAREIDTVFLGRVRTLPFGIVIPYASIEPIRRRRVDLLYRATRRIFEAWPHDGGARGALKAAYTRVELERLLFEWLRLYAMETQVLSQAVRLPGLLVPLRERIAEGLGRILQEAGARLAHAASATVFRR